MRYEIFTQRSDFATAPFYMGWSSDTSVTRYGPGSRDQYLIHFVTDGVGYFNGRRVGEGQGFLVHPGMLEHYYPDKNKPWTFLWIVCYGDEMKKIFKSFSPDEFGVFSYSYRDGIKDKYDYFVSNAGKFVSVYEMLRLFFEILSLGDVQSSHTAKVSSGEMYLEYAVGMIERSFSDSGVTVADICKKLGVSEPYLFKLFKTKFSKSPKRYLSDLRIKQSKILLSKTDLSITEIGCAVGYDDVLAFSKFFSHEVGMSPTDYRAGFTTEKSEK